MIYRNGGTHGALLFECPHTRICATSPACPEYPPTGSAGQPEYPPSRAEPSREIVVIAFSPVLWVPRGDCSQPAPSQLQPAPSSPPVPRQLPASSQPAPSQLPASSSQPLVPRQFPASSPPAPSQLPASSQPAPAQLHPSPSNFHKIFGRGGVRLIQDLMSGLSVTTRLRGSQSQACQGA